MKEQLTILGIPGSLRRNSFNHGALRAAQQQTPEGVRLDIYELTDIPLFNADVEVSDFPATARDLQERIRAADGLLIVTPEYLHSIPGVLKNAIDWASRGGENSPLRGNRWRCSARQWAKAVLASHSPTCAWCVWAPR